MAYKKSEKKEQIYVEEEYDNTSTKLIKINEDKLRNKLRDHRAALNYVAFIFTPFSIAITSLIALLTSEFSDFAYISSKNWEIFVKFLFFTSVLFIIVCAIQSFRYRKLYTLSNIIERIKKEA